MFYKVSYNQGFCSLLGFGSVLKKKSQYLADRAGYCDFAFCYMCLFDAFFYRLQYIVENHYIVLAQKESATLDGSVLLGLLDNNLDYVVVNLHKL